MILETTTQITTEHNYSTSIKNKFDINQEYADNISILTTNPNTIAFNKKHLPTILAKRNLQINTSKTEEFKIKRNGDNTWKSCKLLCSLLDTQNDIKRRKGLAISTINNMKHIFYGKLSITIKLRAFNCYVESMFLYNSELWIATTTLENTIDAFQRRLLRTSCLNIRWPKIINNKDLYELTQAKTMEFEN